MPQSYHSVLKPDVLQTGDAFQHDPWLTPSYIPSTDITVNTMPTQQQHTLSPPIPLNDPGLQVRDPTVPQDPMPDSVLRGVGQHQLIPHEYSEALDVAGDFENTSPGPMVLGAFGEMSDNEWTGRLYSNWNGTYAPARALAAESIGDPYVYAFL
jgi:hypothetical protein